MDFPNPVLSGCGYDDGYFGSAAVAVALHEMVASWSRREKVTEIFLVADHHLEGGKIHQVFTVHIEMLPGANGGLRFRYSDGGGESSLDGGPTDSVEISRAVADLTARMSMTGRSIYRRTAS